MLGGSFDPVHNGHLALAETVAKDYDLVLLIPAALSPFKGSAPGASASDRLDLIKAAIGAKERLAVDDCEIRRGGLSYTADTIADLERRYHIDGRIGLVIGDDLLSSFSRWHRADYILDHTQILVAKREVERASPDAALSYRLIANPPLLISSSDLRLRIAKDETWRPMVPPEVARLIMERRLYGFGKAAEPGVSL